MRINTVKHLLATRDGLLLQNIVIDRFDVEKPLEHTKKKITMEMLPQEAADVVIDNIRSDPGVLNFQMLESVPVSIDDRSGFKILFSYQNQDGLEFKSIYCGFVAGTWLYVLRYTAPSRHYFHKDVGTFETVLNSFRISEKV